MQTHRVVPYLLRCNRRSFESLACLIFRLNLEFYSISLLSIKDIFPNVPAHKSVFLTQGGISQRYIDSGFIDHYSKLSARCPDDLLFLSCPLILPCPRSPHLILFIVRADWYNPGPPIKANEDCTIALSSYWDNDFTLLQSTFWAPRLGVSFGFNLI